jgi:hypothetical protein
LAQRLRYRYGDYLLDFLLLIALCLLFFWRDLTPIWTDRRSFAIGDFTDHFYVFARYKASRLQEGHLPLWNPYTYAGHPFLADIQSAVFYPINLLAMLITWLVGHGFSLHVLELEALAHFPLVALSTYGVARRWTHSRVGGLVAAITFTFSGYLTSYPPLQLAILETQAWLPLILLCLDLAGARWATNDRRSAMSWSIAAGLLLGISLLAGHPQAAMLVGYGSLAFALLRLLPFSLISGLGLIALFGLVGLGLAMVQLLPSWEFMHLSTRVRISFAEAGSGFTPYDLLQLILPAIAVPFPALYVGVLPLGLAVAALIRNVRNPQHREHQTPGVISLNLHLQPWVSYPSFWGGVGILALLLSFGKHLPVYQLFYLLLPGWRWFRHQERTIVWTVWAIALLAGYGAAWLTTRQPLMETDEDELKAHRLWRGLVRGYAWAALGALVLALLFFIGYQAGREALWGFTAATLFLASLLGLSALALRSRHPVLLCGVLVLDLFTLNVGNHSGEAIADPFPSNPLLVAPLADTEPFRIVNEGLLPANYGLAYGLEDLGGESPLRWARYQEFLDRIPQARAWKLLNVGYVLSAREALDVPAERIAVGESRDGKPAYLYRLADRGARAWLVGEVVVEPNEDHLWQRLASDAFDPARQVLLPALPEGFHVEGGAECHGRIVWQERRPEFLALEVSAARPCILVFSELAYPGWQAFVNDARAPMERADGILRALALPAGTHQVVLRFQPTSLKWGAGISLATLLGAVGGFIALKGKVFVPSAPHDRR